MGIDSLEVLLVVRPKAEWASQAPAPPAPCWTWMNRTPTLDETTSGEHLHAELAGGGVLDPV